MGTNRWTVNRTVGGNQWTTNPMLVLLITGSLQQACWRVGRKAWVCVWSTSYSSSSSSSSSSRCGWCSSREVSVGVAGLVVVCACVCVF